MDLVSQLGIIVLYPLISMLHLLACFPMNGIRNVYSLEKQHVIMRWYMVHAKFYVLPITNMSYTPVSIQSFGSPTVQSEGPLDAGNYGTQNLLCTGIVYNIFDSRDRWDDIQ